MRHFTVDDLSELLSQADDIDPASADGQQPDDDDDSDVISFDGLLPVNHTSEDTTGAELRPSVTAATLRGSEPGHATITPGDDVPTAEAPAADRADRECQFKDALSKARARLERQQVPANDPPSRAVQKLLAKLSSLTVRESDDVVAVIDRLGAARSPAAIAAIAEWSHVRDRAIVTACASASGRIDSCRSGLVLLSLIGGPVSGAELQAIVGLLRWQSGVILPQLLQMSACRPEWTAVLTQSILDFSERRRSLLVHRLRRLWRHSDPKVASLAVIITARIPEAIQVDDLARLMKRPDAAVRVAALQGMIYSAEKKIIRYLNAAMSDPAANVRAQAALGLQTMQSPRSVELLLQRITDSDVVVRRNSAVALLRSAPSNDLPGLADAVRNESDVAVTASLLEVAVRHNGIAGLGLIEQYIHHDNAELRPLAVRALRNTTSRHAVPMLTNLLQSGDPMYRRAGIDGLARIKWRGGQEELCRILKTDDDTDCRAAAARALGRTAKPASLSALEQAAADVEIVQCQAVIAIGQLKQKSAVPFLAAQLTSSGPEVQYHCCRALAELNAVECAGLIRSLLQNSDSMLKRGARVALENMGLPTSGPNRMKQMGIAVTSSMAMLAPRRLHVGGRATGVAVACIMILMITSVSIYLSPLFANATGSIPVAWIRDVSVNAAGSMAAVVRQFGVIEVWDVNSRSLIRRVQTGNMSLNRVLLCGDQLVLLANNTAHVWDAATDPACDQMKPLGMKVTASCICMAADANLTYLIQADGLTTVFDMLKVDQSRSLHIPFTPSSVAAVSADARVLAVADRDGRVRLIDPANGAITEDILLARMPESQPDDFATCMALSGDGRLLAIGLHGGPVVILDTVDRKVVARLQPDGTSSASCLFFAASGKLTMFDGLGKARKFDGDMLPLSSAATQLARVARHSVSADGRTCVYFADESREFYTLKTDEQQATCMASQGGQ
jgi:HEAT repeat protein